MKTDHLVQVQALAKRFEIGGSLFRRGRAMHAVRDVSLSIGRGEVVGVVGESGCGKSTLARLVLRLIEPTSGTITFDGIDVRSLGSTGLRRLRQRMAMVFQDPYSSLDPRYTIADVLSEPFAAQSRPVPTAAIPAMLDAVGLPASMAGSYPHQLSGGQRQRAGIARALALNPDFIILDEPTASLDVSVQAQIVQLLADLRDRLGLTYLFISHDLGLVKYFCDRIVVMYLGSVVEILPNAAAAPRHPYTLALIDSSFSPDPAARREIAPLSGEVPSPFNLPEGCAFAGRCPRVSEICRAKPPALTIDAGHAVACFNPI
jgi:oligopeptide/dipeptide ABC transporter ATP-binding protein